MQLTDQASEIPMSCDSVQYSNEEISIMWTAAVTSTSHLT